MTEQLNIILVPHTHWDREWYQTFQQFRMRLVRAVDKLLDILDRDPNFTHFMLDGQTIVLDDYLEVRPEEEARLKRYTRAGRVQIGPWYVQPDEFLVSGEALVRNLRIGLKRAAEFGEPMRVGYVPDCFGHIAQMPQILAGVGIDNAVFWRGVGSEAHKSEFYWQAPDGTKTLVIHLSGRMGYSNARDMPLDLHEFVTRVELLVAPLLPKATSNTLLFMNGSDHLEPQDGLPAVIQAANQQLASLKPEHAQMLTQFGQDEQDGMYDSMQVHIGTLPEYIAAIKQHIAEAGEESLQVLSGEMRSSQYSHLLPSVLSTRMWIKQQSAATEHLLERWVEPLGTWAAQVGAPYPRGLVQMAWKYLLQNHPHDSICGCSIDQVHRENSARFAQSQQIGEQLLSESMHALATAVDTRPPSALASSARGEFAPIIVFNPAPGPRSAAVEAEVQLPSLRQQAIIVDERGQRVPYRVVKRWRQELGSTSFPREMVTMALALEETHAPGDFLHMAEQTLASMLSGETPYVIARVEIEEAHQPGVAAIDMLVTPRGHARVNEQDLLAAEQRVLALLQREDIHTLRVSVLDLARETIEFIAADLPGYGLKTYWVYPRGLDATPPIAPAETQFPMPTSRSAHIIENEHYRVEADPLDGTLTVTDKATGTLYPGLNRFVDGGDVGDLYNYCPPEEDLLVSEPEESPSIEVMTSPVYQRLHIHSEYALPRSCVEDRKGRSAERVSCSIVSDITLVPGTRRIDIHTRIENLVKDHRIRVAFPVLYTVESAAAEGAFEVRTRPVEASRPEDISEWEEAPVNCFPQKRFVDVSNGEIGLAVLNRGLPEYEITKDETGKMAIALTLLRCVEWLSRGDLSTRRGHAGPMLYTPEGQCLGTHEFDYALVLHRGGWEADDALVLREAQAFNTPARLLVTEPHAGTLPSTATLFEAQPGSIVVSAIKRRDDGEGVIVRIYNPLRHAVEATLQPGFACSKVFTANLLEEPQEQLFWSGDEPLHVGLRAAEIATFLFV